MIHENGSEHHVKPADARTNAEKRWHPNLKEYYLDISKDEQKQWLEDRRVDPLKQWKISPIDEVAIKHWDDYSAARDAMFQRTHNEITPWHVGRADNKKTARLNVIRHLMSLVDCPDKDKHQAVPDPDIVFVYDEAHVHSGAIAAWLGKLNLFGAAPTAAHLEPTIS